VEGTNVGIVFNIILDGIIQGEGVFFEIGFCPDGYGIFARRKWLQLSRFLPIWMVLCFTFPRLKKQYSFKKKKKTGRYSFWSGTVRHKEEKKFCLPLLESRKTDQGKRGPGRKSGRGDRVPFRCTLGPHCFRLKKLKIFFQAFLIICPPRINWVCYKQHIGLKGSAGLIVSPEKKKQQSARLKKKTMAAWKRWAKICYCKGWKPILKC